jgi:AAHS family 4-hydroxybenzoate transporter-like MFS transporter
MARDGTVIDVPRLIAGHKFGLYQFWIIVICGIAMFSSGFNVLALGYLAPAVSADLNLPAGGLTPVFFVIGVATVLSGFIWGPIADRIGRKNTIIIAQLCAVPFVYMISRATDVTQIAIYDFFASFCFYGVVPNAMSLAGEFMPRHLKVTLTVLVWTGFSLGTIAGSPFAAFLVEEYGWRSVFVANAVIPLALALIVILFMQESLNQLLRWNASDMNARIARALRLLFPRDTIPENATFITTEQKRKGFPVHLLFTEGRAKFTLLVWVVGFANFITLSFMNSWLTTTLHNAGLVVQTAILIAVAVHIGGIIGGIVASDLFDRTGRARFYVLGALYIFACLFTASIGVAGNSVLWTTVAVFVAGFFVYGLQNTYQAIISVVYPTEMRSTGTSWGIGVMQSASLFGPVLGGILLSLHWSSSDLFYVISLPPVLSAFAALLIGIGHSAPETEFEEEHVPSKP